MKKDMFADLKLMGVGETHSRTRVRARDVATVIDEPVARGGSNEGPTPTESIIASLIGCANVVIHRLAQRDNVDITELSIDAVAKFDRRGVSLAEEIVTPFPEVTLEIRIGSNATPEQIKVFQDDLGRFCPISTVLRGAGTRIVENWIAT